MDKIGIGLTSLEAIGFLQKGANLHITKDGVNISIPVIIDQQEDFFVWLNEYFKKTEFQVLELSRIDVVTHDNKGS